MKTKILVAAALAVSAVAVYFFTRRKPVSQTVQKENASHHLTNAFSRAKEHALTHPN